MTAATANPLGRPARSRAGYLWALATVTGITYVLHVGQAAQSGETGQYERPYGILYLLSVALIAVRWGGRQGFFALACSLAASKFFLMPPVHTLRFDAALDVWELGAIALVGSILTLALAEQRTTNTRARHLLETVSTQQQELQAVLDSMTDGLIVADLNGNVLTMNPAALRLHGFGSVEEAQRHFRQYGDTFEVYDMDWRPVPVDQWPLARALRDERFSNVELHVRRRDTGTLWDGSYAGAPVLKDGRPIQVLLTLRDVTENRTVQQALLISEERLRLAVEETHLGLWHWDILGDQVLCSLECKALYGLPPDEDISFERFLGTLHPEDRDKTRQAIAAALRSRGRYSIQHRAVGPDGAVHWIASLGHGSYDADGNALYMEGIARGLPQETKEGAGLPQISPDGPKPRPVSPSQLPALRPE